MSLVEWFLMFWMFIVPTLSPMCSYGMGGFFPGPFTVRKATLMLHDSRGCNLCCSCSAWTGSGWCPSCSLSVFYLSLPLFCYHLSAVLVLNPLWVVTGEWSAPHFLLNSAPFRAVVIHLDTSHTFLSNYYPVILYLSISIHPVFGIFLLPFHL